MNKKELSVISLLGDYDEFRPYSIVFDVFDSHEDCYDTLRKKTQNLIEDITDKINAISKNTNMEIFLFAQDPNDKRSKTISLNREVINIKP